MFSFSPLSELDCLNLLQPGEYDFMVKDAVSTISKSSGNPMMKLIIYVYDKNGREHTITDYLLESLMYKVRSFAYGVGLDAQYESGGFLPEHCINRTGRCEIIIDEPQPGSKYNPKNVIKTYIKKPKDNDPIKHEIDPDMNDSIPF
jgi:hypothetical protein